MRTQLYIDGQWTDPVKKGSLDVINPSTEQVIHAIPQGTAEDIDLAVCAARRAFDKDGWPNTTGAQRGAYLRGIAELIRERSEDLARLEVLDNGKPLPEARWDIGDAAGCFEYYAGLAEQLDDSNDVDIAISDDRFRTKVRREAVGVVGAIIPWNYPLLMASWKVAPALAAGCSIVLKPAENTSLTALELAAIAQEAGLPAGVLNIVTGLGGEAGQALVSHPLVDKLAFTGSGRIGAHIMTEAAKDIKRISLELGGKSPLIVFDDADIEGAVEWIMFGIFWNQGQVCSATSRVLLQDGVYDKLLARLIEEANKITIGDGMEDGSLLGPLVSKQQHEQVIAAVARAQEDGAQLVAGGRRPEELRQGYFFQPTILTEVPLDSHAWKEEIFGPVVCVRRFSTESEALSLANDSRYGLAAAVMTKDDARADRVSAALRAGIIWINCSQPTFTEAPWGGYKQSGIGRELGKWGLDNYLETKQVTAYVSRDPWGWYIK